MSSRKQFSQLLLLFVSIAFLGVGCIRFKATGGDGGVFFSQDGGATWQHRVFVRQEKKRAVTIAGEEMTALVFDPKNPSIIYGGTVSSGVYRTENGGESWAPFFPFQGRVEALSVNPKDTRVVFIALSERVFRTNDGGAKWDVAYIETRPKVTTTDIAIDGYDPRKVYVALSNGDLMRSTDNGASWALLTHTNTPILRVLVHPRDTRIITLMTQYEGLYRTKDLGKTWKSLRATLEKYPDSLRGSGLASEQSNPQSLIYLSNFGLLFSHDGGETWRDAKLLTTGDHVVTSFAVAPGKPDTIYYTSPSTLYSSRDRGKTWTTSLLPTTKRPSVLLVHPANPKIIYLGTTKQKK